MFNKEIRTAAFTSDVKLWEIAEKLGIRDDSLSRKLRHELPDEEREKLLAIIEEIKAKREGV